MTAADDEWRATKDVRNAMQTQDAIERAESMGTPQGLRALFPTNLVRVKMTDVRKLKLNPLQRKIMATQKKTPNPDERKDQPSSNAKEAMDSEQRSAGTRDETQGDLDPAFRPVLPRGPIPRPGEMEQQEQGEQGTPHDPGPPPQRPQYTGTVRSNAIDMLDMAAEAKDVDAIRAVRTMNEPPEVAQYKANLLQWLMDTDAYATAAEADRNLAQGKDGDEEQPA